MTVVSYPVSKLLFLKWLGDENEFVLVGMSGKWAGER